MTALLAFLKIALPIAQKYGPELVHQLRSAFTHVSVGGNDADFNAILDANQKDIDILQNPDSLRHNLNKKPE